MNNKLQISGWSLANLRRIEYLGQRSLPCWKHPEVRIGPLKSTPWLRSRLMCWQTCQLGESTVGDLVWHLGLPPDTICCAAAGKLALLKPPHMDNGCLARDKKTKNKTHLAATSQLPAVSGSGWTERKNAWVHHKLCIGKWLNIH